MHCRHADLLAADISEDLAIKYIDRFLMFYVATADRLQRTAPWLEKLEGGECPTANSTWNNLGVDVHRARWGPWMKEAAKPERETSEHGGKLKIRGERRP